MSLATTIALSRPRPLARMAADGALAGALSAAVLLWRGRTDAGSAAAPMNAVSHWIWPRAALRRDDVSLEHTGAGTAIHFASSWFWAWFYEQLRARRRQPTVANAVVDAVAITSVAAVVDLRLVPGRLSPGFEHRLRGGSLALVYAGFAAGLALGGVLALRR